MALNSVAMRFRDRTEAGKVLARDLRASAGRKNVLILALPRGGVPVAFEVAKSLKAPLDIFLVRKLGVPGHEELAMGALATGNTRVLNRDIIRELRIAESLIDEVTEKQRQDLARREQLDRGDRPPPEVRNKTVILVDDGLATGATMYAAVTALRQQHPARIVVAVPAAAPATCDEFRDVVDEIVCAVTPEPFYAVGAGYHDFSQTRTTRFGTCSRNPHTHWMRGDQYEKVPRRNDRTPDMLRARRHGRPGRQIDEERECRFGADLRRPPRQ